MTAKVLIIDDEDLFREDLAVLLRQEGHDCRTASNGEEGLAVVEAFGPDVVLCDVVMPGRGGLEVLEEVARRSAESIVVMITAYGTMDSVTEAFRKGAADYITKPLVIEDVLQKIQRIMSHKRLIQEVRLLRREVSRSVPDLALLGKSEAMQRVHELISKVAPTGSTVLLRGESGTGKEVAARTIHQIGRSGQLPFVPINCAGIPEQLLESELFGHVRGAFTGAIADREGFFEQAGEGTVFLDEIAEMPLSLQSKLLRVLEEKEFVRVGGSRPLALKARVIASTNQDLTELVKAEKFRADLFFRIAVLEIILPPLRERRSDLPLLIEHFVRKLNQELGRTCFGVDNEAMRSLLAYSWPGNVREIRNVIERALILTHGDYITAAELPPEIRVDSARLEQPDNLRDAVQAYEREHIRRVLRASGGNKEEAARMLGINPSTLYRKISDIVIDR